MRSTTKKQNKPVSLEGCEQIFKKAGISFDEYKNLNIYEVFDKAEKVVKEQNITCDEFCVDLNK